jgi:hypothetical protein
MARTAQGADPVPQSRNCFAPVRRAWMLFAVIGFHALMVILLLNFGGVSPGSPVGTLTVFALAPPSNAAPAPIAADKPKKPLPPNEQGESNAPEIALAAVKPSAMGEVCQPVEAINLALTGDEAARTALDALPAQSIGLANSIVIWTTSWSEGAKEPAGPLAPLRLAIESTLATLPQACLETAVFGPRLLIVTTTRRANVLVFGTGQWNWAQLIAESREPEALDREDEKSSLLEEFLGRR